MKKPSLLTLLTTAGMFTALSANAQLIPNLLDATTGKFKNLEVAQKSQFAGEVIFDNNLTLRGAANFQNNVQTTGNLRVNSQVTFSGVQSLSPSEELKGIVTIDALGNLQKISLTDFANSITKAMGFPAGPLIDPCALIGLDGKPVYTDAPAAWIYNKNMIYTPLCTQDMRVGIATQTPRTTLDVNGSGYFSGSVKAGRDRIGGAKNQFNQQIETGTGTEFLVMGHDGSHSAIDNYAPDNSQANNQVLHINYNSGNAIVIGNSDTPSTSKKNFMTVCGNTYLQRSLVVGGNSSGFTEKFVVENGNAIIGGINWNNGVGAVATLSLGDGNHYIRSTRGKGVSIGTYSAQGTGVGADGILLAEGGNVGIGTANKSLLAKLHVTANNDQNMIFAENANGRFMVSNNGRVFSRGINVTMANFPDYVFSEEHKLMSIYDIESYINENHHLPNMPTASEVEKNGANLEEINRILVEKVEELTLYVIQLKKEIDAVATSKK